MDYETFRTKQKRKQTKGDSDCVMDEKKILRLQKNRMGVFCIGCHKLFGAF